MRRAITVLLTVALLAAAAPMASVYSITKRQDPDMPVGDLVRIDNKTFIDYLESLRQLNDSTVNSYVDQIEDALQRGDYEEANRLLNELQVYLRENYGGENVTSDELAKAIATISSTEGVGSAGAYVNATRLLEDYGDLVGDQELLDLAKKLSGNQELTPDEQKELAEALNSILGEKYEATSVGDLLQLLNETGGTENIVKPPPPPGGGSANIAPGGVGANVGAPALAFPSTTVIMLVVLGGILIALVVFHRQLIDLFSAYIAPRLSPMISNAFMKASARISSMLSRGTRDPVVRMYRIYYAAARAKGFKRYKYETPREFLNKITDELIRKVGEPVTRLYEDRIYGGKTISSQELEKAAEALRRYLGVSVES